MKYGAAFSFEYDNVTFMFTIFGTYCECYANSNHQFGFDLGQDGFIESSDEIKELLINNYLNGNIFLDDEDEEESVYE